MSKISSRAAGLIALGLVSAAVVGLSGCSSTPSTDDNGPVTISYAYWDPNMTAPYQAAVKAFNEENPDITVELRQVPFDSYFTKLNTQVSSQNAPDVFWLQNIQFPLYASNGALADLSEYAKDSDALASIPKSVLDPYVVDGKTLALPWQSITFGLYYNKALFDAAGQAYPTNDWTWDDVATAAKAITDSSAGRFGIVAPAAGYFTYDQTIYGAGAKIITDDGTNTDIDSPAGVEGIKYWADLVTGGYSPSVEQMAENKGDFQGWFTSGKAAMISTGSWNASAFAGLLGDKLGIVEEPSGKVDTSGYATTADAISATSQHIPAAYKWAEYLSSPEGQTLLNSQKGAAAGAPVNPEANDAWLTTVGVPEAQVFVDQVERATLLPSSKDTLAWDSKLPAVMTEAWQGKITAQEAADQSAKIIRDALAAEQ